MDPERKRSKALPALVIGVFVAVIFGIALVVSVGDDDTENTPVAAEDPETTEAPASDEPAVSDDPPAASEPEPPSTTTVPQPSIVNVGTTEWFTWEDGLEAQVTSIEQYTPEYDSTPTPDVAVTVTIKNGTGANYDATQAMTTLYGGPNGVQAEDGNFTYYGFEGNVPAGGTATAGWSFTVPPEHLSQLKVELSPGYSDDTYMTSTTQRSSLDRRREVGVAR